ncbi:Uncharacterised protein [uncultured archaeon]|nr:Uncharacterised protein [uncultured archaeon]
MKDGLLLLEKKIIIPSRPRIGVAAIDMQHPDPQLLKMFSCGEKNFEPALIRKKIRMGEESLSEIERFLQSEEKQLMFDGESRKKYIVEKSGSRDVRLVFSQISPWSERAYSNVATVLSFARERKLPIALVQFDGMETPIHPSLVEAAGEGAKIIKKSSLSAVGCKDFILFIEKNRLDDIVVMGWNKICCTIRTARDLINKRGKRVITCEQTFRGAYADGGGNYREANRFYRTKTEFYLTVNELLSALDGKLQKKNEIFSGKN